MSDLLAAESDLVSTEFEAALERPKLSIQFGGKYKSITAFAWNDIPEFAVITGVNGTGKSQLLELINTTIIDDQNQRQRVTISGKAIGRHEVTYLKGEWELQGTGNISIATVVQAREGHYNNFRSNSSDTNFRNSQIKLYETFQDIKRITGKQPADVSFSEFEVYFPEVFVEHESHLSTKIGELFVKYRMDEIDLLAQQAPEEEIRAKLKEKPWEVLRRIIETAKLPFNINDPSTNRLADPFRLKLTHQISNDEVYFHDLSSGEKVLMSLVFYLYNSKEKGIFPKLFLLDEPDAHLHPSMSQVFIDVMKKVLSDELGVQVIMTTHSPSTVALAPEEAIFIASRSGERIQKASKDAALKLLTAGVPSFSVNYENRRQVFVESEYDVYFYESIYEKVIEHLEPEISLSFIASGETRTDRNGMPVSNSGQVKNVTRVLRDAGNKFVWGLVDWDTENDESEYEFVKVLGSGNRYSIESYLCDPVLVASLLLREKLIKREELGLPANATHIEIVGCDEEQLQTIADFVVNKIRDEINPSNDNTVEVYLLNKKQITVPLWYLHHQGHDLENALLKVFPNLGSIKRDREDAFKKAIIDKVIDDAPELISIDFVDTFKKLQSV